MSRNQEVEEVGCWDDKTSTEDEGEEREVVQEEAKEEGGQDSYFTIVTCSALPISRIYKRI